mgnify:CR=1 FL=1
MPSGDGHAVLVFPGLGASDISTLALRRFLKQHGYQAHGWKQGLNLGEGPVVTKGVTAQGESIHTWLPVVISGILRRHPGMKDRKSRHRPTSSL